MKKYRYTNIPSVLQGDVPDGEEVCFLSGKRCHCDFHHVFGGTPQARKRSEEFGLWVWLEHDVHMNLHGTKQGQEWSRSLKQKCQQMFELEHPRSMFIRLFHRNYL